MLYNKREKLTKPFDDPSYISGYNNGIFLFKYHYDSSTDLFFKDSFKLFTISFSPDTSEKLLGLYFL